MREIYLIRHGQSQGNANKDIYKTTPDYALRLTEKGYSQALDRGIRIAQNILCIGEPAYFYCSPFYRTRDTLNGILDGMMKGFRERFPDNNNYLDYLEKFVKPSYMTWTETRITLNCCVLRSTMGT